MHDHLGGETVQAEHSYIQSCYLLCVLSPYCIQCDLPGATDSFNTPQMEDFCKENNFLSYFPTSAKEDIGINEAANSLVAQVRVKYVRIF